MALAFLSVMLQRPIPQDIASSGELAAGPRDSLIVRAVQDPEHAVKATYHRNLRLLIVPRANESELRDSTQIPPPIRAAIVRFAATFDEAVRLVFGQDAFVGSREEPESEALLRAVGASRRREVPVGRLAG